MKKSRCDCLITVRVELKEGLQTSQLARNVLCEKSCYVSDIFIGFLD